MRNLFRTAFRASKLVISFAVLLLCLMVTAIAASFAAPGDLDASFGTGGKVLTHVAGVVDFAQAVALQTDGKIVVVGYAQNDFAVVRYNPNGSLDTSFGSGGKVLTPVGTSTDEASAVVIQTDGKIVVAGRASVSFAVVRLNTDGTLDTSFGTGGKVITSLSASSNAEAVAVQTDGKIVVAGWSGDFPARYTVLRYNADGTLDQAFGTNGRVNVTVGMSSSGGKAFSMALQPDGKIILGGSAGVDVGQSTISRFSLVRLTTTGVLDASFGAGGKVLTAVTANGSGSISDVAIQPDGKIVASGRNNPDPVATNTDTAAARYNADGSLDASFGAGGIVTTRIGSFASDGQAVAVQANGKIVVAGNSYGNQTAASSDFGAVRFNPDGSLDSSFGIMGKVITAINSGEDLVRDVVIQADGKIIVIGRSEDPVSFDVDFALLRYLGDASAPRRTPFDFDGDGKTDYAVFRPSSGTWYLQQSQNGFTGVAFGTSSDKLVPADYDGDGKADVAVYRAGIWYLNRSSLGFTGVTFGDGADIPQPADFDGDGKAELAVFRPSNGTWYLYNLASGQSSAVAFGASGDKPVAADYDGDGKVDVAVFRPSSGTWYLNRSQAGFIGIQFGLGTDKPVVADYDGDGKADVAVARQTGGVTTWYVLGSTLGFYGTQFGSDTDRLVPGDYDGDGKADTAVWRSSTGAFYVLKSSGNQFSALQFGQSGDVPVVAAFVP